MTKRTVVCGVLYVVIAGGLLIFQPATLHSAQGQAATLSLVDAYGAQATLNALATQSAYSQQQSAAQAQQAAAAAQAQAAALQAQAYAQAQQATASAQQQQAQIAAAQATADAAALQATAIVQQTRTAIEIAAQQTRSALEVRATQTAAVLQANATQAAIDATHAANEAKRRDDEAVATSVAISVRATQTALDLQSRADADQAATIQRTNVAGSLVITIVMIISGMLSVLLLGKFFRGLWRSRALNPTPAPPSITSLSDTPSAAANSVVDAATGDIGSRFAIIEHNADPAALTELLRSMYGR
jgi:hypothetical protein